VGTISAVFVILAAVFFVMSIIEIYVIVQVGQAIGALNTIFLLIAISLIGAWLAKHEGASVLTRLRRSLDAGQMPTNELIDGGLILAGGILLITPGFITDILGIVLLFPPTRAGARAILKRRFKLRIYDLPIDGAGGPYGNSGRYDRRYDGPDDVIDV
jgi:UPF0716 protein FxsA